MGAEDDASSRLRENKEKILAEWEDKVRQQVPAARQKDRPALLNSLPKVLDRMAQTLSDPESAGIFEQKDLAADHGHHRAKDAGYSLDQVIGEYHVLRRVLFDVLEADGRELSREHRELILDVLFAAIRNAAAAFMQDREKKIEEARLGAEQTKVALANALGAKAAEALLRTQLLATIFERVEDYAMFSLDPQGRVSSWTKGCERIKQYTREDVIGHHYSMLYPEEGRRRNEPNEHLRIAQDEGKFRGEGMRRRKSGELFLADVFITPMYEHGKLAGYFKIVTDLTERNRMIQERDLSRTRVESLELESELRERFVFMLSHDLRNPLSAAKISAQIIARRSCDIDQHRELARRAAHSIGRVDRMITDLLDVSRIRAGQPFVLNVEESDLCAILRDVYDDIATMHGDRFDIRAPASLVGFWDSHALRRVVENLVNNAIKYGDPSRIVTILAEAVESRVLLKVHNFGTAISVADQESLFELFRRSKSAEKNNVRGWGLGLALVRGIVEAHGGIVKVQSLPMAGTTFTLDLPRDARDPSSRTE